MKNNNRYFTPISIGVATVWFSTHCGAGFASGTQELQYFSNHGWFGIFMPIITFVLIALVYYVGLETARQTDKWGYNQWGKEAFGSLSPILNVTFDISVIIVVIAATAATIATGGVLVNQYLGMPVLVGSVIMVILVTIISIFGANVVRKNAMVMTTAILIILSIVLVAGIIKYYPNIVKLFKEGFVNPKAPKWSITDSKETVSGNFFNSLLWALTYSGFQISAVAGIVSSFQGGIHKKEAKGAMALGCVLNLIMLIGICLLIFSQMPAIYNDEAARTLPTVFIIKSLDIGVLSVLYPVLLFLALITTAVGLIFGMINRLEPYVFKKMDNQILKRAIIAVVCMLVCYLVSTQGLMWVIKVAYKYLGIFNWIFLIIPLLTIGFMNIRKRDKLSKEN